MTARLGKILCTACLLLSAALSTAAREHSFIVLRAQFNDTSLTGTDGMARTLLDRCESYFDDQFLSDSTVTFTLGPIVTLDGNIADYAQNLGTIKDYLLCDAIREACRKCDDELDFSPYDGIVTIMAGPSEADGAGTEYFWPQSGFLKEHGGSIKLDGVVFDRFTEITETCASGTLNCAGALCHELSHTLGLMDMYDADGEGSGGICPGLWGFTSIMDNGALNGNGWTPAGFNAIDREILGTGAPEELCRGHYELEPINGTGRYLKASFPDTQECFLFECRDSSGWDRHIGGAGMLIYHIDRTANSAGESTAFGPMTAMQRWELNQVNCAPGYECADLLEADPEATEVREVFWPQEGHDCFGSDTRPAFRPRYSPASRFALVGISYDSFSRKVSFDVIEPLRLKDITCFQRSAIIDWEVDSLFRDGRECSIEWRTASDSLGRLAVTPRADSCFTCTIERLQPGTDYYIRIEVGDKAGLFSLPASFKTKKFIDGTHPYIKLAGADRNKDGSFRAGARIPLKVDNIPDREVSWTFNGNPITTDPDGYWRVVESGTLRALITDDEGNSDIIIKEITV